MKNDENQSILGWLRYLERRGLTINSLSAYEQSMLRFISFLRVKKITLRKVRPKHVSDFILDRYERGNSEDTVMHFIDCIRQYYKFHRSRLEIDPEIFNIHLVRSRFKRFEKIGVPREKARGKGDSRQSLIPVRELKETHGKFHPRG